ncbi:unnamed protein product [Soboliphyme baturini]|uniref:SMB domain-containing protein n=1 Tax=Soboliphyme baturini TaxID=241478 RepID=A0A183IU87_9BILA|nr:unnamed protein product [Soboliphyme baturini]
MMVLRPFGFVFIGLFIFVATMKLVYGSCVQLGLCCSKRNVSCFSHRGNYRTTYIRVTEVPPHLAALEASQSIYPIFIPRVVLEMEMDAERLKKRQLHHRLQHRQSMRWNFSSEELGSGDRMEDWEVEEELHHWKMHADDVTTAPTVSEAAAATPLPGAERLANIMVNDEIPKFVIRQDPDFWSVPAQPPNRSEICYCDEACSVLGDCCWDYHSACSGIFQLYVLLFT